MENYTKGKSVEEEFERSKIPIKGLPENFLWMQVKAGSKMINLLSHVTGILQDDAAAKIVWSAAGAAIPKAISCVEIIKRQFDIHHQITKLVYKTVEEHWEPKVDGLETLVVKRQIPVIHILMTADSISNVNQLGYQTPNGEKFWLRGPKNKKPVKDQTHKTKKPFKDKRT